MNKRDASKADCKGISEEMGKDDWKNSQRGLEINEAYNQFFSFYEQIWNEYVPFKRNSNKRKGRERMSEEIRSMIKHKLWYKIKSEKDKIEYRARVVKTWKSLSNAFVILHT